MLDAGSQATGSNYSKTEGKKIFIIGPLSNMNRELGEDCPSVLNGAPSAGGL